jgi:hypothetical protein
MSTSQSVFVDFGNADDVGIIRLIIPDTLKDLARLGIQLKEGLELHITDGEISASAVVQRRDGLWVARVLRWD